MYSFISYQVNVTEAKPMHIRSEHGFFLLLLLIVMIVWVSTLTQATLNWVMAYVSNKQQIRLPSKKLIFYCKWHEAGLDLVGADVGDVAGEDGLPPRHHRLVVHLLCELRDDRLSWQPWGYVKSC